MRRDKFCPALSDFSFFFAMNFNRFISAMTRSAVAAALFVSAGAASAYDWADGFNLQKKDGDQYALIVAPYTRHFTEDSKHKYVWLVGIERERADQSLAGVAFFSNSFGQPSTYIFPWGMNYHNFLGQSQLTAKITAGLLYGYRGEYKDKVPFNHNGFSPAIVPGLAWELGDGFRRRPTCWVLMA